MIGPHPKFLGRDPRGDERQRQLFGDLIDSCVDFGTRLLGWVLEGERVPAEKVVPALMLRDFLAHLDGASSLIRTGCPEPTQVVLRAALEAYLNLIYVASEDLKQRVACYSLSARHRLISFVHRRDPARDSGGRVAEMIQRDTSGIGKYLSTLKDLPPVDQIRAELSSEPFAEIEKEWHRTKKERRRTPKWYALFRGPENLEHLADRLERGAMYELFYREWSGTAHIENVLRNLEEQGGDRRAIPGLRQTEDLQLLTSITISLALRCFFDLMERLEPERFPTFFAWYVTEVEHGFREITSDEELIQVAKPPPEPTHD